MRKRSVLLMIFLVGIFLIGVVSAEVFIGELNHSISKVYGRGDSVSGWVNFSVENEPTTSTLKDSRNGSISLLSLLKSGQYEYSCTPSDCASDYSAGSGATSKAF